MQFSLLSYNISCIEWRFDSSVWLPACIYVVAYYIYTLSKRTADCDVIVNIHGLSLRNVQPIWCDVASVKLNELIITLVVQRNGRIHWARHHRIGVYKDLSINEKGESRWNWICVQNYMSVENVDWNCQLRYYISYDTVELLISTLHWKFTV